MLDARSVLTVGDTFTCSTFTGLTFQVGLIVRDFGTHVVISSEIGAEYVLEDHIDVDESQDITEAIDGLRFDGRLSALGRLAKHFGSIPGISGFYSSNPEVQNFTKYESNIRKMRFDSSGYIDPPSRANANDESVRQRCI